MIKKLESIRVENLNRRKKFISHMANVEKNKRRMDAKIINQMKALGYIR